MSTPHGQGARIRRRAARRGGLAIVAAALAALAGAPVAAAGQYSVDICQDWTTDAAAGTPLGFGSRNFAEVLDTCAAGGRLRGRLPGPSLPAGDEAQFGYTSPSSASGVRIRRIQARYVAAAPSGNAASVKLVAGGATLATDSAAT